MGEVELGEGESLASDATEHIYRQICDHMYERGAIASHAFASSRDNGAPSYGRSSLVTAQVARDWHNANLRSNSREVRAVTVGTVALHEFAVIDDSGGPLADGEKRAPGHCFIALGTPSKAVLNDLRSNLLREAIAIGEIPTSDTPETAEDPDSTLFGLAPGDAGDQESSE